MENRPSKRTAKIFCEAHSFVPAVELDVIDNYIVSFVAGACGAEEHGY